MATRIDKLFVEVNAETSGFERGLKGVDRELGKFAEFVKGKPLVAAAAFGSSLLLVANQAQQMAREVDAGVRKATQAMPGLASRTGDVRKAIEDLSLASGRAQADIAQAFATAANTGVEGFSQLNQVVRTAVRIADATGEDVAGIIGGIDLALDGFGISAARAADVGARLFAVAQGRFGFTDLTAAIQPVVPILRSAGVSFEVMIAALGNLLDEGKSPKQAAAQLKEMAKEGAAGAEAIKVLAGEVSTSAENFGVLKAAQEEALGSADALARQLDQRLAAVMIRLGNRILPFVASALEGVAGIFDRLAGDVGPSKFADRLDQIPGTLKEVVPFITQQSDDIVEATEKLKQAKADLDAIAKLPASQQGAQQGRSDFLRREIATAEKDIAKLTEVARAAQEVYADLVSGGGSGTGGRSGGGSDSGAKRRVADITKALEELAAGAKAAEAALQGGLTAELTALRDKLAGLQAEAAKGGQAATEQAAADAARTLEAFVEKAGQATQDILASFTRTTGEAARRQVFEGAEQQLSARNTFDQTVRRNIDEGWEATLARVRELTGQDDKRLEVLREQGRTIREAVDGALDLASAFGLVDDRTADVLSAIAQVGTSLPSLVSALSADKLNIGSIVSAGLPVLGGLAQLADGLFGESPELKAAKEAIAKNTVALDRLREEGLFNTDRAGSSFISGSERIGQVLDTRFSGGSSFGNQGIRFGELQRALDDAGLTLDELKELAESLGPEFALPELSIATVDQFIAALGQLQEGLGDADITGFANTFVGQLEKLRLGFQVFGTDTQGQFDGLIGLLTGPNGAKGLFDGLKELDLGDPEDAAKARDILEGLFASFESLTKEDLGGLNPQEFLDAILTLLGLLPPIAAELTEAEQAALAAAEAAERFANGMAAISRAARVFDLSTLEQVEQFFDLVADLAPAIGNQLRSFDLSSVEGVNEAIAYLQDLFLRVEDGTISLEGMGFSIDDIVQAIDMLQGAAREAADEVRQLADDALKRLGQDARVFDPSSTAQLQQFFATLAGFSPAIAALVEQFDLSNVAGIDAATAQLQALYEGARDGTISLEGTGLTIDTLVEAVDRLQGASAEATKEIERLAEAERRRAEQAERDRVATGDQALRQLADEFRLFGIVKPQEQLQQRFNVLNQGSGGLFGRITGGANLADPTGQAAALEALKRFFLDNPQGVDAGFFGADAVRGQVLELAELIKATQELAVGETGGVQAVGISRTISEVTGDRMAGLLGSQLIVQQDQLGELRLIRALLTPSSVGTLTPPSLALATSSSGGAGGGTTIVSIGTIEIALGATATTPDGSLDIPALTQLISQEIVRQIAIQRAGG